MTKNFIKRRISAHVLSLAEQFPVVTILGPRQSGKTTLARALFPKHAYVNLEAPETRAFARSDPKAFLQTYAAPAIFDEIQNVPELLSYLQIEVDSRENPGEYVLTGSHQPRLSEAVSQSLAGRTGIARLLPLSLRELADAGTSLSRDEALVNGFLPRIYARNTTPFQQYLEYYATYVERDVRRLVNIRNAVAFDTFVKVLAGRVGQVVNYSSLANDVGISVMTAREWISILEASFIIFRLPPYFENFGKRMIKSPKIYFVEPGLVAYLLELKTPQEAARDPLLGGIFENLVVVEALKARCNAGEDANLYFMRDEKGFEIDLLLSRNRKLFPFEIKAGMTWTPAFAANLEKAKKSIPKLQTGTVIYAGDLETETAGTRFVNFSKTADLF